MKAAQSTKPSTLTELTRASMKLAKTAREQGGREAERIQYHSQMSRLERDESTTMDRVALEESDG